MCKFGQKNSKCIIMFVVLLVGIVAYLIVYWLFKPN